MKLIFIFLTCLAVLALADEEPPVETTAEEVTTEPQTSDTETKAPEAETPEQEIATSADTTAASELETSAAPIETETTEKPASIAETSAAPTLSCDSWPTQLKTLRECCEIPDHTNTLAQSICQARCSSKNRESQFHCVVDCYVRRTHLMRNGAVDKAVARKMFETNAYDRRWRSIIDAGVKKCEYTTSGSLNADLAKFFDCVSDYLAENCINFVESPECDATQEHFEICHNVKANCSAWPMALLQPDGCCLTPLLSVDKPKAACKAECQKKEMFVYKQTECELNCTLNATGVTNAEGAIDYATVKKFLMENATKTVDWEKPIEYAVGACEKMMAEFSKAPENHLRIMYLEQCLALHLSDKCVDFRTESYCNKVKRFMKQCPETKSRRQHSLHYSYRYNQQQHHG